MIVVCQMNTTLFIETSGPYCSLALRVEGEDFVESRKLDRAHNEHVLAMLDGLYERAGLDRLSTNLIGFSAGPGSFTGVRIGAAIAQAIGFASDAMVVPVSSSLVLAITASLRFKKTEWITSIKSRKDLYYWTHYSVTADSGHEIRETLLFDRSPVWLEEILGSVGIVGDRPEWLEKKWVDGFVDVYPEASAVLDLIEKMHLEGRSRMPEEALPIYVEGDSPWVKELDRK